MTNPLLAITDLPAFDRIAPEHVAPAVDALLADAEQALETVTAPDFPADWTAISRVLDVSTDRFGRAWGAVSRGVPAVPPHPTAETWTRASS